MLTVEIHDADQDSYTEFHVVEWTGRIGQSVARFYSRADAEEHLKCMEWESMQEIFAEFG